MNEKEDNDFQTSTVLDEGSDESDHESKKVLSFYKLYRFSTLFENFLLFIGFVMSIVKALTLPAVVIVYSEFTAMLVDRSLQIGTSSKTYALPIFGGGKMLTNATKEENMSELYNDSISYGILLALASIIMFISGVLSVDIFNIVALRQITRMRKILFETVIRQDIEWHDMATKQNFTQQIIDDVEKVRDGISEKVAHFLYLIFGFIITVCISFAYGWKLTLAVSAYIPIVIVLNYFVGKYQSKLTKREQESYAGAGNIVEEVLTSIRTVVAFGAERKESERYDNYLVPARKASQRKGAFSGFSEGVLKSMLFLSCAGAFWYGVNLIIDNRNVEDKEYTPAILMIAFFGIIVGADNIARTAPFLESFSIARGSATNIFKVIDTKSKIDPLSSDGKLINYGLRGEIEFKDVFFRYPSRPDVIIHRGINLKVNKGQTVALVGSSGCGKSTCIQLLQRFYDPIFGSITLDGLDIRKYNIHWLRSNIAVVGQEPVLFQGTIADNISYGKTNATQREIEAAAKTTGVHDFICSLPESYLTVIGEKGSQLSGGQKQRIAIARALIQDPKILLLDEATSALDYHSEKDIQKALDLVSKGRTTIVVSHRLSAIRGADKIVFLHEGKVFEEGSHDDLMTLKGMYYNMVRAGDINIADATEETTAEDKKINLNSIDKSFETDLINMEKNHISNEQPIVHTKSKENAPKEEASGGNFFITFKRILKLARPEWCMLLFGAVCAIAFGFTYPAFSVIFGEFYAALAQPDEEVALHRTSLLSIYCLILGVLTGIGSFLQTYLFNYAGVWLTTRIRSMTFTAIMRQEIGWFDEEGNSVGALSARLTGDASGVQGAIGYPLSGLLQAFSNFVIALTLSLYFSWKLALVCMCACPIIVGSIIFESKVSETLLYGSMMLAQSLAFAPAFTAALVAAHRVFQILDRSPKVSSSCRREDNATEKRLALFEGVRFSNIEFRYPTRSDVKVLNGLNLEVLKGKTVALVGRSGCGKSTCIQLLMRLYDPDSGTIKLNEDDIHKDISIESLRRKLGLVSQEPSLFERTIAENIAYGDNSRRVTIEEIIAAAKCANAHSFIITLPNGYDTRLGARGTQISGGQKQRIAIARALVRNPKILLLDEATSALDLQSEQLVQQALDVACTGRTCIVIAHRLSTVQNADVICVLKNGKIVEIGNHQQLVALNGIYAKLHKMQSHEK
ncbi:multidrug resistance protein homolog 65 isoform X2 [Anastrepha obliqua]|uniref:multidrug resistance protein homolog 65 isoform X2 n=1 Tax=Anastrepha obliqua TaxID=95512 RepID=UPI0024094750|nr:multidrug resistance protein homolog 65 isoform X2 [Anastrepha obliqua]